LTVALATLSASDAAIGQTSPGQGQIQRLPDMDRPIFLSGQVVLEDGTPPPEQVLVQRACDQGRPIPEGYTDARGRFSFELGRNRSPTMDAQNAVASDPFGSPGSRGNPGIAQSNGTVLADMNPRDLTGCELRI
jgi:hypothetical protein